MAVSSTFDSHRLKGAVVTILSDLGECDAAILCFICESIVKAV